MSDINIKELKSFAVGEGTDRNGVHEVEMGSDCMYINDVRQAPRLNNVPVFRDNGYQLDFTVATGGNINFNGTDYPQSALITSFEAEGKTWLLNEFSSNIIESETGDFATVSVNEGNAFLDSDVWQKKSFALEFDSANSEYVSFDSTQSLSADGDFLEITVDITNTDISSNPALISDDTSGHYLAVLSTGRLFLFTSGGDSLATLIVVAGVNVIRITKTASGLEVTLNGLTETSTLTTGFNFTQLAKRLSSYVDVKILDIQCEAVSGLKEGLGDRVGGSITIESSHADRLRRINYGMWQYGDNNNGWFSYT
jgi:hypothetical protein